MKKKILLLVLLFNLSQTEAQTNLVPNGDIEKWDSFNTNPASWFRFINGIWERSTDFQQGTASVQLEIVPSGTLMFMFSPNIQFTKGTTYICSFYYKLVSGNVTSVELNLVHTPSVFPESLVNNSFTDLSTAVWKKGTFEFTATTSESVQVYIYVNGAAGSRTLIDNVSVVDKSTLSTTDYLYNRKGVFVFPNPTSNYIEIAGLEDSEKYTIYDSNGKIVNQGVIAKNEKIDINKLAKGAYFIKLDNGLGIKLIKN